jgi:GAF domain-containing protein
MDDATLATLLERCAAEPIHVPEAVQPFGALVAVDADGTVRVRSEDPHGLLAGEACLGEPVATALGDLATAARGRGEPVQGVLPDGRTVDVSCHPSGGLDVLELEEVVERPLRSDELVARQRPLWQARSVDALLVAAVEQVRALTGFDRVMAYRFDPEWNGEVVAESRRGDLDPYLGLWYPASDIPAQARALYRRNPSRLIADVDAVPAVLTHEDPAATAPLDLSDARLRSVSPVHLQYLRNMGVAASMSLSLLVEGELWGLLACHHVTGPRRPDPARRRAASAVAELTSALLVSTAEAEQLASRVAAREQIAEVRDHVEHSDDPLDALAALAVVELVGAGGAVVSIDGRTGAAGSAPEPDVATADARALLGDRGSLAATDQLERASGDRVGALAVALGDGGRSWITWYRPELVREVRWAGDPRADEVVAGRGAEPQLGPRRSFDTFVESVTGRSRPWSDADRWAASQLAAEVETLLARRRQDRLTTAAAVQRALLLDTTVRAPGFDVAVRYLPAKGDPVGGDWYDVFHLNDGSTAFVVGDAAGHGLEVAGIMAQLRHALRAYLLADPDPTGALDRLDELVTQLLPGQLATAVVCVVDPASGSYRAARAGHLAPFVVGAGAPRLLELPAAPALGLRRPGAGHGATGALAPGEGLVLFSDGLVEHRGLLPSEALAELGAALGAEETTSPATTAPAPMAGPGSGGAAGLCDRALAGSLPVTLDDLTVLAFLRSGTGRV